MKFHKVREGWFISNFENPDPERFQPGERRCYSSLVDKDNWHVPVKSAPGCSVSKTGTILEAIQYVLTGVELDADY